MDWEALTNAELLGLSGGALAELRLRGVVRSGNAPAGDLAERLVADAMGGELAPHAQKSWDVLVPAPVADTPAQRVQVKARVVPDPSNAGQRQVSAFRSWECDAVMFVLFDAAYSVRRAALLPIGVARDTARRVEFTASFRVFATDALLARGDDWTGPLRSAALWTAKRSSTASRLTTQELFGATPAGGVRAVAIRDDAGRILEITEYAADGKAIMRSYARPDS